MKKALTILALLINFAAFSQVNNAFFQMPKVLPANPEASALFKVSNVPIEYSSGAANIDIPIYTVKDGNISIPISITYNTSGIKVQDVAGVAGLGWNLNAGGMITVRGQAFQPGETVMGSQFKQESDIETGSVGPATMFLGHVLDGSQEKQLPVYYYNFGNYSGSFFYDINQKLSINSNEQNLSITPLNNTLTNPLGATNGFVITTPGGLQYTFNLQVLSTSTSSNWNRISAYYLSSIVDLNTNRKVTFTYKGSNYCQISENQMMSYLMTPGSNPNVNCYPACISPSSAYSYGLNSTCIGLLQVDSIKFSTGFVKFTSSTDRLDMLPLRVRQVSVYNSNNILIKNAVLNQTYFGSSSSNYRLKLDSIVFKDINNHSVERYGFSYNTNYAPPYLKSPNHVCTGVDYWGYYNGKEGNGGLVPKDIIAPSDLTNYQVSTTILGDRKPDSLYAQAFILNQITYPTGGVTKFTYESNYVHNYALGNVVGGLRIKKISYFDNIVSVPAHEEYFKYLKDTIPLIYEHEYSFDRNVTTVCANNCASTGLTRFVYSDALGTLSTLIVNPFYPQVEVYEMNGSSPAQKTAYYYDTINQFWIQPMWFPEYGNVYVTDRGWLKGQLLTKTEYYKIDKLNHYQLIKKEENTYSDNSEAQPLMGVHVGTREGYDFVGGDYCEAFFPCPGGIDLRFQYQYFNAKADHGSRTLLGKRIVDYTDADSLVTATNYAYALGNNNYFNTNNYFYYLNKSTTVSSEGDTFSTTFKYPIDGKAAFANLDTQSGIAIDSLTARNIISPVLETQYYANNVFLNATRTNYALWPGNNGVIVLPKTLQFQQGTNPYENRIDFINYDNYGNLLSVQKDKGAATSYIWGYKQNYLIVQVANSPANDVFYDGFEEGDGNLLNDAKTGHYSHSGAYSKTLTGLDNGKYIYSYWQKISSVWTLQSSIVTVSANTFPISLNAQIDDIKFYTLGDQMYTFTFDPLLGLTSSTDVKGNVNYYEYDYYNRLLNVKDYNGNILKNIQYNYNPLLSSSGYANSAVFQAFSKNNCATGYHGAPINYYVPARTYYAATQTAADAFAQNDINSNGQNYANNTGGCDINKPVITAATITGKGTANLAFTSIPNCTNTLINYVNTEGEYPIVPPGTIAGNCTSPAAVSITASPGTYIFTITCYSAAYPSGVTSDPITVHFPF